MVSANSRWLPGKPASIKWETASKSSVSPVPSWILCMWQWGAHPDRSLVGGIAACHAISTTVRARSHRRPMHSKGTITATLRRMHATELIPPRTPCPCDLVMPVYRCQAYGILGCHYAHTHTPPPTRTQSRRVAAHKRRELDDTMQSAPHVMHICNTRIETTVAAADATRHNHALRGRELVKTSTDILIFLCDTHLVRKSVKFSSSSTCLLYTSSPSTCCCITR